MIARSSCMFFLHLPLVMAIGQQVHGQMAGDGQQIALLMGVEKYQFAPPLKFIYRDIDRLAEVLRLRATEGFQGTRLFTERTHGVTKSSMLININMLLNDAQPGDRLVLYFSGHGFRGKDGQHYLAPADCKPQSPEETGLPIQVVRDQMAKCKASFMLLVLDACHAGAERETVPAQELGEPFRELPNVVTIASSKGTQPSQLWDEKEQSLFSYWLCQALAGHADANGDSAIDVDELYTYVYNNVTRISKRIGREQTPVRIICTGTLGVPIVLRLRPQTLDGIIDEVAQQVAWSVEENKVNRMAVFEFTEDTALGKVLGAQFGVLGRYCAARLQEKLLALSAGQFRVADQDRVEKALQVQKFSVDDLARDDALKALSEKVGGLGAISLGTFQNRVGRELGVRCRLVSLESGEVLAFAGGRAKLNDSEWAMLGGSGWLPTPQPAPPGNAPHYEENKQDEIVKKLEAQTTHPLRDPRLPFRVRVMVGGKERQGVFAKNSTTGKEDYVVSLRQGEVYSLWVENRTGEIACLRLLVDGLNTLPEKVVEKGLQMLEAAPRVNISSARAWVLDPYPRGRWPHYVWAISGFVTETGGQVKLREFQIIDADASVAARKNFTDQIGLITAALYHHKKPLTHGTMIAGSQPPGAGTGFGQEQDANLAERRDIRPGELWAVINIRYVLQE